MGIALFTLCFACVCGMWYFLGRVSIYAKLIKEYREALEVIGAQETIIHAYKIKYNTEKTEGENGKQD